MRSVFAASLAVSCHLAMAATEAPVVKADAAKGQSITSQVCAACHGTDGNSAISTNPSLAGQPAEYITKQLDNFKSGARKNAVMAPMVATLSPEDMKNIAVYYAAQTPKPRAAKDRVLAESGQRLYRGGNAANGLPACAGCHAPDGSGLPALYPRLAGQPAEYVLTQLRGFRLMERANDKDQVMRSIAARLSDRDMQGLAEYVSGLR
jgi:cytochrome c553